MSMTIKFYDTSALLCKQIFYEEEHCVIPITVLRELENIKTSLNKDENIKTQARKLLHYLDQHYDEFEFVESNTKSTNPDVDIMYEAIHYFKTKCSVDDEFFFVTNDISLKVIAKTSGLNTISEYPEEDSYVGYIDKIMDEEEMAYFYSHLNENIYNLYINQYINVLNENKECVDSLVWTGNEHQTIKFLECNSVLFGKVKPKDVYQRLALDSFKNNTITYISGPPGSGKTMLALAYLFQELEKGHIDHIVVFCNPIPVRNSAKLGLYPGDKDTKLLQTQVGYVLSSKLGGIEQVQRLIDEGELIFVPAVDARGFQTPPNSGVYILECQNTNVDILQMLLQRIDDTSIVICDGDHKGQIDLNEYDNKNGALRMSQVFRGDSCYGQVQLNTIFRSHIANIAERM